MIARHLLLALVICGIGGATVSESAEGPSAVTLYVATNGSDQWSGRLPEPDEAGTDGPFASIDRARTEVRRLKRNLRAPIRVTVREGTYELRETLRFTREDGGTATCPITYQAQPGERVVIRGGRRVTGWRRHSGAIYRADLRAQGMGGVSFRQLFYRGRRRILARHPNFDPERPRSGGFAYVQDAGPQAGEQFIYKEQSIPFDKWDDISQAEIVTIYADGWNFAITPVLRVNSRERLVTVRPVRRTFKPGNRFFVRNVLAALDAPGEWYLDRRNSILYFRPPDGRAPEGDVVVPLIDHLIEVRGVIPYPHGYLKEGFEGTKDDFPLPANAPAEDPVEHITFRGFRLECARQDAIRLIGARHCAVIRCVVTNVGGVGINLGGVANRYREVGNPRLVPAEGFPGGVGGAGQDLWFNDPCQDCRVVGNDVYAVGADGIFLYGTGNLAENNHVYDIGRYDKDCAAINTFGEKTVVRRNELHDVPRNAIFLKGSDIVIELNNVYRTMLETRDGGAIRMCQRNPRLRGNVIRFNKVFDTVGYGDNPWGGRGIFRSPCFSWGIYLDDFTCGTTVYGNIIVRTGRAGIHVHGGSDNNIENNVIVDAPVCQFECNPIGDDPLTGNRVRHNVFFYDGTEATLYQCSKWAPGSVTWEGNLVWCRRGEPAVLLRGGPGRIEGWAAWQKTGLAKGSVLADPRFRDPASEDYRPGPNSPAWKLGFTRIPVERVGCYPYETRASWPLRKQSNLVRED